MKSRKRDGEFLARTPRLQAQRELRKNYQKLADGELSAADFLKARATILDGTKLSLAVADNFADKVIGATRMVVSDYYQEENQGELVSRAVHKLYRSLEEKVPDAVEARLATARNTSEDDLKQVLIDARMALGAREDLDKDKDVNVALYEMLHSLDPYSTYVNPETVNNFKMQFRDDFIGVGFQVRKDAATDYLLVVTPIKGSPAYKAGILAGDLITTITRDVDEKGNAIPNGPERTSTKGLTVNDAIKKILGAEGSKVWLTVRREGVDKPLEFEITRGRVQSETVFGVKRKSNDEWDCMLDSEKRIGYIRISQLLDGSYDGVVAAVADLKKQGMRGLVLDLRFNPGGTVQSATDVSDLFIDDGVIVSIRKRGKDDEVTRGKHEGSELDFPMVVLANDQTGSGAEIVTRLLAGPPPGLCRRRTQLRRRQHSDHQQLRRRPDQADDGDVVAAQRPEPLQARPRGPQERHLGCEARPGRAAEREGARRPARPPAQQRDNPAPQRQAQGDAAGVQGSATGEGARVPGRPAQGGFNQPSEVGGFFRGDREKSNWM